jgi:glycosyltransferase involved in cell wall biosynthesis
VTAGGSHVSVVVPCYNYGRFLPDCMESLLAQTGVAFDVLVVDDCSTDDSWEIAQKLAAEDDRVQAIRNDVNRGMIATINAAMWSVAGDYVVKLDADDMLTPGSLARSVAMLDAHPTATFSYGVPIYFTHPDRPPARTETTRRRVMPGRDWIARRCAAGNNCIGQPEVMIRTAALKAAGHYNPDLPHTSDFEMWLRLAAIGDIAWMRVDQGWMRRHPDSMQRTVHPGDVANLSGLHDAFVAFFAGAGAALPEADRLLERARRRLATAALALACRVVRHRKPVVEPIDAYVAFALDVYPAATGLSYYRELELRRRARPVPKYHPRLVLGPLMRKTEGVVSIRRLRVKGV